MNIFQKTTGEFVLKVDGEVRTYTDYNDVPKDQGTECLQVHTRYGGRYRS